MKKFLIILAITILAPFVVITNASADELNEIYTCALNHYKTTDYYETYPYCVIYIGNQFLYCTSDISPLGFKYDTNYVFGNKQFVLFAYWYNSKTNICSTNSGSTQLKSANKSAFSPYTDGIYGFDLYDSNNNLIKNADFDITKIGVVINIYTITFNPPKNTTIVVKDNNGLEVKATSQYVYELSSGTYTYSASNSLYSNLTDIEFTVSSDTTIDVNMEEKLQSQPMKSIFTQYYNYISDLVGKVFDIENPILLFFVSFIIGFSLIILIKRLIGGIF